MANYKKLQKLGKGGSGLTYLVEDADDTRNPQYCMKEFRFGMQKGEMDTFKAWELFGREAQILKSMDHPQIPRYLDFFTTDQNGEERLSLVMEYVPGKNLEQLMSERRFREEYVLGTARTITNILEYLHGFSPPIIHRDIKPKNLIMTPDETIKLVDFGSVADTVLQGTKGTFTRVGTYGFAAPELLYGKAFPASDIYSLGATLMWLLSGGADPVDYMNSNHRIDLRGKLNVSTNTEKLLWDMTEPDLNRRIKDTKELRIRLDGNELPLPITLSPIKTTDEIAISFFPITREYHRYFGRSWGIDLIFEKFTAVLSGIRRVLNDYGQELQIDKPKFVIRYGGTISTEDPSIAKKILPTESKQRIGLDEVKLSFKTPDKGIRGQLEYDRGYRRRMSRVMVNIDVGRGFTLQDREKYLRLYHVINS
ncbi:MAG: serine/threonine protein kinase [Candidatus Aenigmarchaeota archaeon]|nr:serine/threonine protein kinase [Candidatus Aenigmarchaeota archaeon]